ncbi:hypothetical protein [Bacteroides zoogleoformans]|uniref:hypothetical protein n=1 Tax=Bacteroides zoogleoformans TaxID=28119 RepID=UPI00101AED13|nr:hypothetical protein [Bacteroides zoogleoformans]
MSSNESLTRSVGNQHFINEHQHRFNLSRDSRLYKLIDEEGARGYGSYLFILEQLYSRESGRLFIGQLKLIRQKGFPQAYLEK